jgi:8-oxo-dGTP diphosphatase
LVVTRVVQAAGGIVVRRDGEDTSVALVHRPRYDDWTFPKGKLQPQEVPRDGAVREVFEETGLVCGVVRELGAVRYRDSRDRPKRVRYYLMVPAGETGSTPGPSASFEAGDEVDEMRWVGVGQALQLLSYPHDRDFLRSLGALR